MMFETNTSTADGTAPPRLLKMRRAWSASSAPPSPSRVRAAEYGGSSTTFLISPTSGLLKKVVCVCVLLIFFFGYNVEFPGAGRGDRCSGRVLNADGTAIDDKTYWRLQLSSLLNTATLTNHAKAVLSYSKNVSHYSNIQPFDAGQRSTVWDYYTPTVSCPNLQRIGRVGDGGKWLCALRELQKKKTCVVYSYGVSIDASFEEELLLQTNCTIFAFDPSTGDLPHPVYSSKRQWAGWRNSRIFFHKIALGTHSGRSDIHMLTENIFDTMKRLNHSYVDVLKIDVEGFEWELFRSLARRGARDASTSSSKVSGTGDAQAALSFPFGQLLIELHYQSMQDTNSFFDLMSRYNQYPYSREVNLQPCLEGYKPFAVEYSFINPHLVYLGGPELLPVPAAVTPGWPVRASGVFYYLTQRRRAKMMVKSLASLYRYFWSEYPFYPVVVFHDDLRDSDQADLQKAVPAMKIDFIDVSFRVPNHIDLALIPNRTDCSPDSSTLGYRHMCRFHATGVHAELLSRRAYADVEYIIRLDDDSYFTAPVGYDLLTFMKINGKKYAFPNFLMDDEKCVRGLWNETRKFADSINLNASAIMYSEIIGNERITFYNNFEISHASLWKDPLWKSFIGVIDRHGGIYTGRWGDAPIHTLGVSMLLSKQQVHSFTDIGYTHAPFIKQTPSGLPIPSQDPLHPRSGCKYYGGWTCSNATDGYSNSSPKANPLVGYASMMRRHWTSRERHVIYSFGHRGREDVLSETINGLYKHYSRQAKSNLVVFIFKNGGFNRTLFLQRLSGEISTAISVIPVESTVYSRHEQTVECGNIDSEIRAVAEFMRFRAIDILRDDLKFDWFIRIADESRFLQVPTYNAVDRMHTEWTVYAYTSVLREYQPCSDIVWNISVAICNEIGVWNSAVGVSEGRQIDRCSSHLGEWPHGVVTLSNFEISHSVVWSAAPCQLLRILSENSTSGGRWELYDESIRAVAGTIRLRYGDALHRSFYWSDGSVHTACMLMAAPRNAVLKLDDFKYAYTRTQYSKLQSHGTEKQEPLPAASEIAYLNGLFSSRKMGWLGGDIATSFALPCNDACNDYVWLFGDSLVGTSDDKKRLNGHMVSNTVAHLRFGEGASIGQNGQGIRQVDSIKYYWRELGDGKPSAIFSFDSETLRAANKHIDASKSTVMWPIAGMSFSVNGSEERAIVMGPVIQHIDDSKHPDAVSFSEKGVMVAVVRNPRDPADSWIYSYCLFPSPHLSSGIGDIRWTSLSHSEGFEYSSKAGDFIYLLGFHLDDRLQSNDSSIDTDLADYSLSPPGSHQVVGRARASDLVGMRLQEVEVLLTDGRWTKVYKKVTGLSPRPARLFEPRVTEASLQYNRAKGQWQVLSLQPPQDKARLCSAARIEGPWSCRDIYEVREPFNDFSKYITYAAKLHPEFAATHSTNYHSDSSRSKAETLIISVVSNTLSGFGDLYTEEAYTAYVPRFVSVTLSGGPANTTSNT